MALLRDPELGQRRVFICSSIVLSLFSIVVSLSSISLSILLSSSCGPMYCPGLRGEGSGSMGLGRSGSGRLGRSNRGPVDLLGFSVFRVFIGHDHTFSSRNSRSSGFKKLLLRVETVAYSSW